MVDHVLRGALQALRSLLGDGLGGVCLAGDFADHLQQLHVCACDVGIAGGEGAGALAEFFSTAQRGAAGDSFSLGPTHTLGHLWTDRIRVVLPICE